MGRLIEASELGSRPAPLILRVGDVILFDATGGRAPPDGVVELVGPLVRSVVGADGEVVAPMGAPNALFVRALRPGRAKLDLFTGDPWCAPQTTAIVVLVEP